MNLSGIPIESYLGKALRAPLRWIPRNARLPILQGRLRGKRWIVGSSTHGCWLGSYEIDKRRAFEATVTEGSTVFDVGAHVGFYSLLASELVGSAGKVVAFEPFPRNLGYLREHLRLNAVRNVEIVEAAVTERSGTARFAAGKTDTMGHLAESGELRVGTIALDEVVGSGGLPAPDFLKIDVEGGELLALRGARRLLETRGPTIFLATHGSVVHEDCCRFLSSLGYSLRSIDRRSIEETDEILAAR
jgi:FkbM family methyltransferase